MVVVAVAFVTELMVALVLVLDAAVATSVAVSAPGELLATVLV